MAEAVSEGVQGVSGSVSHAWVERKVECPATGLVMVLELAQALAAAMDRYAWVLAVRLVP